MAIKGLPQHIAKYFWGDDMSRLDIHNNSEYIIETILNIGNEDAVKWLFLQYDKALVERLLPKLSLNKKSGNFWNFYLS